MEAADPQLSWLAAALDLTEEAFGALAAAAVADPVVLTAAAATVQELARRIPAGAIPGVVRRPLAQLDGRTLLDLLLTDPLRAQAIVLGAFDWSGTA